MVIVLMGVLIQPRLVVFVLQNVRLVKQTINYV